MRRLWILLLFGCCLVPTLSTAGTISVDFDLTGSSVGLPNGLDIPPGGEIQPGAMLVLHFTGDVAPDGLSGTVLPGASVLDSLGVAATIDAQSTVDALFTGDMSVVQFGEAGGNLAGDLTILTLDSVLVEIIVYLECAGVDCELFGLFPLDIETFALVPGQTLTLTDVDSPGGASLAGLLELDVGGFQVSVDLQGAESSRTYVVPEPSSGLLLLIGLALLRPRRRH